MPWATVSQLPSAIRRVLPPPAQQIFRAAANSAEANGADDSRAITVAWAAVRRAGYSRGANGLWRRTGVGKEGPRPLYVYRKVLNGIALNRWVRGAFNLSEGVLEPDDLHVTVTYSKQPVDWMEMGASYASEIEINEGGPRMLAFLGAEADALVLKITHGELSYRHHEMVERGASWDWEGYKPHVTLAYLKGNDRPEISKVNPPQFAIKLGPEIFAPIDEDWKDKVTAKADEVEKAKWAIFWERRTTPTVVEATTESEARRKASAKKKDGYGSMKNARKLTASENRTAARGGWVRTRSDGKSPDKSPQRSRYRPQLAAQQKGSSE